LSKEIALAVLMPWILFLTACVFFWCIGKALNFQRSTTGALMLVGGLANTSFVGLPMIEAFYGTADLPIGILIDQLGTYLVLSTLGIAVAAYYGGSTVSNREMAVRIVTFPPMIAMVLSGLLLNVAFPAWLDDVLARLSVTLVPLALVSVGLQLRFDALNGNLRALFAGLSFKLILGPAVIAFIYVFVLQTSGQVIRVTLFEAAMGPMIGAAVVASQCSATNRMRIQRQSR
jgi:predicted permease